MKPPLVNVIGLTSSGLGVWGVGIIPAFLGMVWSVLSRSLCQHLTPNELNGGATGVHRTLNFGALSPWRPRGGHGGTPPGSLVYRGGWTRPVGALRPGSAEHEPYRGRQPRRPLGAGLTGRLGSGVHLIVDASTLRGDLSSLRRADHFQECVCVNPVWVLRALSDRPRRCATGQRGPGDITFFVLYRRHVSTRHLRGLGRDLLSYQP